jgi:nucleotide-binding universal stress UspA family protein
LEKFGWEEEKLINSLMVAVDGSNHSLKAVEYAADIAAGCKARLIILTVVKPNQSAKVSAELRAYAELEHIAGADHEAMKRISNDLLAYSKSVAVERGATDVVTKLEIGPIARTIVTFAKQNNIDMIVIGSRGLGNIEATLRGGVSHRVELLAKCSVLTVK